ncbi:hypothetical protein B0H13DRAFT_1859836 [Mycena leptocephala]|nr:hypothetical protein B0H13DRAFT_1859836 [Mycena leptocephala]
MKKEKSVAFRPTNPSPQKPASPPPAPSYNTPSVHFASDSEANSDSRKRALPPYPSPPSVQTGWAALSDVKSASAFAMPPRYPEDALQEANPYPSPFTSQSSIARSESVASSSRLPPTSERPEYLDTSRSRSDSNPPHYSPNLHPHSRLANAPGAISHPQTHAPNYPFPEAAYPTPHSSSFSLPSRHHRDSLSSSSDSISGGSLTNVNPAMRSTQSVSTSSSGKSDPSPTAATVPTPLGSAPFVFPSSRSRARPSGATPGVTGFKFRGRRKLKTSLATVEVLAPGTPIPAEGVFTAQPPAVVAPNGNLRQPPPPLPQNLRLAPTVSAGSGSSDSGGGIPATPTPATFYFPSSRTRAHPKSPTQFSLGKGKKKDDGTKPGFLRMGLNRKKVAAMAPISAVVPTESTPEPMAKTPLMLPFEDEQQAMPMPSPHVVTKIGMYPLDAYNTGLIESDRQTWELLRKLNSTNSPSFHNYGARPPHNVLDLGCGAGHWMLDAAMAWRNSGTQIIGFDMVDTTKALWPVLQRQGIENNIKFVRGNLYAFFLFIIIAVRVYSVEISSVKQPLPFPDDMASARRWGRLEFIDDHVFFPYGKPPLLNPRPQSPPAPQLDMMIPSTVFSRMSLTDVINPNVREDTDSQIYDLYGVEEEDENSDGDTVASGRRLETPTPHTRSSSRSSRSGSLHGTLVDPEVWHDQAAAAREVESLFEHMMNVKFGIHLRPSEFVLEMLMRVFGGVKEMNAMHLTLAPPEQSEGQGGNQRPNGRPRSGRPAAPAALDLDALSHCPGLVLWPSTFIPMPLSELETHASKHMRILLSCKTALVDFASEIADQDEGDTQSEAAMEAMWEYQNFLRERFNPPPDDPTRAFSDASSSAGDANSIRNSISSMGTDAHDAMWEYQSELRGRFAWTPEAGQAERDTPTPTPSPPSPPRASVESTSDATLVSPPRPPRKRSRGSRGRDRATSTTSTIAPPYSRIELTHVRTFYVYEAVKQAED